MKASDTAIFTAFEDYTGFDPAEPEKNLMWAVLRTAMEDLRRSGEAQREAKRYFMSDDDFYLYSFVSVCQHLRFCPRTIRMMLGLAPQLGMSERVAA